MKRNTVGYTESPDFRCLEDLDLLQGIGSMNPLNLYYCGTENCTPGWRFGPYVRDNYVIHAVISGRGTYRTAQGSYELSGGDMFIIYPGEETVYEADMDEPWSYAWIGFNGRESENVVRDIGFLRENPVVSAIYTKPIKDAIERIMDARQLTHAAMLRRRAAFYDALALMMEQSSYVNKGINRADDKYVSMAVSVISNSYPEKIRIADIASDLGINRSYLTSIFRKRMHVSPQEFLINLRLEKAAQMLRDSEEPVGSIAAAVGYNDALAFSKAFKQKYGESPSIFRRSEPEIANMDERGSYEGIHKL